MISAPKVMGMACISPTYEENHRLLVFFLKHDLIVSWLYVILYQTRSLVQKHTENFSCVSHGEPIIGLI